jgi:peptidyl-prolyl cis-trans isomerase C
MGRRGGTPVFAVLLVVAAIVPRAVGAEEDERLDAVVAKVGATSITVREVEQRLRAVPGFQLEALAPTPEEARRRFLEEVMIKEMLFSEAAKSRKLEQDEGIRAKVNDALRVARINLLRDETTVSADEIAAFYRDNRARFDTSPRVGIFRILCASRTDAEAVLAQARSRGGLQSWNELARERSLDKTTHLRGGNLGFVAADGSSSEVTVRVNPALYAAADRVKDGELVAEPVAEGAQWAVVWRRGSVPAIHRTLDQEASAIRQVLLRQKLTDALRALLDRLRSEQNLEKSPQLIDVLEVTPIGDVAQRKRPGIAPHRAPGSPEPTMTPRGLR